VTVPVGLCAAASTINLMLALRDSAVTNGQRRPGAKIAAKKKSGRRALENPKPAAPRRKAG
jgi:hypothetical protein